MCGQCRPVRRRDEWREERGQPTPSAPVDTVCCLGDLATPWSCDPRDKGVSYQGARGARLSRGSQKARLTLRITQRVKADPSADTPTTHQGQLPPSEGQGGTASGPTPDAPRPCPTHHRSWYPSKTLRPDSPRGPLSPQGPRPPWRPVRTWLPLKWTVKWGASRARGCWPQRPHQKVAGACSGCQSRPLLQARGSTRGSPPSPRLHTDLSTFLPFSAFWTHTARRTLRRKWGVRSRCRGRWGLGVGHQGGSR